jgi:hypothetical protein
VDVSGPFFTDPARAAAGLQFFEGLAPSYPEAWCIYANIPTLARTVGDSARATQADARATQLKASGSAVGG